MPEAMERKLRQEARKKGLTGKRADAYVYGTMQRVTKWKPKRGRAGKALAAMGKKKTKGKSKK